MLAAFLPPAASGLKPKQRRGRTTRRSRIPTVAKASAFVLVAGLINLVYNDGRDCASGRSLVSPVGFELFTTSSAASQDAPQDQLLATAKEGEWSQKNEPPYCQILAGPDRSQRIEVRAAMVVLYTAIVFYTFMGLGIICDDYFTAALERICYKLDLSEDVGGE